MLPFVVSVINVYMFQNLVLDHNKNSM